MNPEGLTAVGLLTAAVVALWGVFLKKDKETMKRLDACESDRKELYGYLHKLELKQAVFHACNAKPCPAKDAITAQQEFDKQSTKQTHNET